MSKTRRRTIKRHTN